MTKRWTVLLAVAATLSGVMASAPASAQEVQVTGPLAGQPAVRHMRIYRSGRFQLQPTIGFTLQDEYSRTILFGGQLAFHLTDWLGIGVWGAFGGVHFDTGLTDEVEDKGQATARNALSLPSSSRFSEQIGEISWVAAAQLSFIPLRGKLALFQKLFIDTDFYLFGGAAFVGVEERAEIEDGSICASVPPAGADESNPCIASQTERESRVALAPTFGVGLMLYFNDFMGLSLEWRGLPFSWNTSGTDEVGGGPRDEFPDGRIDSDDRIFHFNHLVNIGLSFYLPAEVEVSE